MSKNIDIYPVTEHILRGIKLYLHINMCLCHIQFYIIWFVCLIAVSENVFCEGWVNDFWMFIFGWTTLLILICTHVQFDMCVSTHWLCFTSFPLCFLVIDSVFTFFFFFLCSKRLSFVFNQRWAFQWSWSIKVIWDQCFHHQHNSRVLISFNHHC